MWSMKLNNTVTYNELIIAIEKYMTADSVETVKTAYKFAQEKHEGQYRRTGEEYINHPLACALILTTIFADCPTITSTLLHDTIEDTDTTKEEIEEKFGKEVATLVDSVTKINNINISTENEYLTNYYKKIIV